MWERASVWPAGPSPRRARPALAASPRLARPSACSAQTCDANIITGVSLGTRLGMEVEEL